MGRLREATEDDADAILDLALLHDLAEVGEASTTIDEVRSGLDTGGLASAVIDDPAGGLIGHVWIEHQPGHLKTWGDITVRPGAPDTVAPVLLDWLRDRSEQIGPGLPIHTFANSKDVAKQRLFEAAGGTVVRRFYRMAINFADVPPAAVPELRDGVEIRLVARTDDDLHAMHAVIDEAFMDHFGHERQAYETWLHHTADGAYSDLSLWWLAIADGDPAAGLYSAPLSPTVGYIDTLGTLRAHRGNGLGRALLLTSFAEFHRRGIRKVVLGVDATNPTGALGLYESVGMTAQHEGLRYELPGR
jgi:mycothiol synthase